MRWQQKLTKGELRHLRERGITTLASVKHNAERQKQMRDENHADGLTGAIAEPCYDCKHINRKLGLPV